MATRETSAKPTSTPTCDTPTTDRYHTIGLSLTDTEINEFWEVQAALGLPRKAAVFKFLLHQAWNQLHGKPTFIAINTARVIQPKKPKSPSRS